MIAMLGAFDASDPGFAWIALSYATTSGVLAAWLYVAGRRRWGGWLALAPALAVALATLLRVALTSGIDADESEHLHLAFAIARDVMPYRDLGQNHTPFLWMLTSPLLALLPESPYVLLGFRAMCLASFAGSIAIACRLSKRLLQGGTYQTPLCVLLGLAYATQAEFYRFRPDAFMNTLALASLVLLVRPNAGSVHSSRAVLLAGLCQGLAMAFSPKVGHLALAAPLLLWLQPARNEARDRWRSLVSSGLLYGVGLVVALAPVVLWLAWNGLLTDAYEGIVSRNLGSSWRRVAAPLPQKPGLYNSVLEVGRLLEMAPFFAMALGGAMWLMLRRSHSDPSMPMPGPELATLSLRRAAAFVWLLWMALWTFTPNAATYHIGGALVLAGAFGAPALDLLAARWRGAGGRVALAWLIALCLGMAPMRAGIGGFVTGYSYPLAKVAWLQREVRQRGEACLCIVPWHPIFVANVAPVYRNNEIRSGRWSEAVAWTLSNRPAAVMAPRFAGLVKRGILKEAERARLMAFLNAHYELVPKGSVGFWLLREDR